MIQVSIDGANQEAISALLYEHYKKQGYHVKLIHHPNCKQVHEIKRFFNLCNHEIALLHAFDSSLNSYTMGDYDIVIWNGSIIRDYMELANDTRMELFIKQINKFSPKMDTYFYINSPEEIIPTHIFKNIKNWVTINGALDINLQYKAIIDQLNKDYPHCKWCNHIYKKDRHHYNYCSKTCSGLSREKQNRDNSNRYYQRYRNVLSPHEKKTLGSNALLKPTPNNDFSTEHQLIQKEKQRLGLN